MCAWAVVLYLGGGVVGLDCQSGGGVIREEGATVAEECVVAVVLYSHDTLHSSLREWCFFRKKDTVIGKIINPFVRRKNQSHHVFLAKL